MTAPLHFATVAELAKLIAAKQLSPVEVTRVLLERIDRLDGRYRCYATRMEEDALAAARAAEGEILAGRHRGPLHGVPVAVKDLCFTAGVRTMGGCKVLADFVPAFDATVVARLRAAGAVLLGKLNLTEGAMGGYNPDFAIPRNPWNAARWPGASSSGPGVATAAGLCVASLGSDTGGSIRFPAACCGTVGLKPTWGRVSRHGVLALAESLDHVGPITRSVADAGILLQAIAGPDPLDPTTLPEPVPDMLAGLGRGVGGVRIGYDPNHPSDVDAEIAAAVDAGVAVLAGLGAEIVELEMPDLDPYVLAWPILCTAEAVVAHAATYPSRKDEYGPWFRSWLDIGASVSGADYARANLLRLECNAKLRAVFARIDVLACPTTIAPAFPVTDEMQYGPMDDRRGTGLQRYTVPSNFNGAPALPLPCGFSHDDLPLSLQLVGKPLAEPLLIQVGDAYEQATDWHRRHPPVDDAAPQP
jgi:amidase